MSEETASLPPPPPEQLTIREAMARLGVTERTLRRLLAAGTLPSELVATGPGQRQRMIPAEAVDALAAARAARPAASPGAPTVGKRAAADAEAIAAAVSAAVAPLVAQIAQLEQQVRARDSDTGRALSAVGAQLAQVVRALPPPPQEPDAAAPPARRGWWPWGRRGQ